MKKLFLKSSLFILVFVGIATSSIAQDRAYAMLLTKRKFSNTEHVYVVLGHEYDTKNKTSGNWNLPGGKVEKSDKSRGIAVVRELY